MDGWDPDDGRIRPHWSEHYSHQLQHQGSDGGVMMGRGGRGSWSRLCGPWDSIQLACLEGVLAAARGGSGAAGGVGVGSTPAQVGPRTGGHDGHAREAALRGGLPPMCRLTELSTTPVLRWRFRVRPREHHPSISPQIQVKLMESLSAAASVLPQRHRSRPGQGPGPLVILRRLLPAAPPLQPVRLALAASTPGAPGLKRSNTVVKSAVFIFNPYAVKRQEAVKEAEAGCIEWACEDECRVELYLVNPLAVPLRVDGIQLHVVHSGTSPLPHSSESDCSPSIAEPRSSTSSHTAASSLQRINSGGGGLASGGGSLDIPLGVDLRTTSMPSPGVPKPLHPSGAANHNLHQHATLAPPTPQGAAAAAQLGSPLSSSQPTQMDPDSAGPRLSRAWANQHPPHLPAQAPPALSPTPQPAAATPLGSRCPWASSCPRAHARPGWCCVADPLVSGSFTVVGCSVSMWGMTWIQPFCAPSRSGLAMLGKGRALGPAGRVQPPVEVEVLPQLPLLQAVLHTGHDFSVTVPCDADIHAPMGQSPGGDPMGRPAPLEVLEGQECRMLLALNNIGGLPISAVSLAVVTHKGVQLKPLLSAGSGSGRGCSAFLLPASFVGAHMEVDDSSLASSLPLQPAGSAMLPVRLLVGRAPRNTSLEDFTLEIRVTYAGPTPPTHPTTPPPLSPSSPSSPSGADPMPAPAAFTMGRRMSLALPLRIKPSLSITGLRFLEAIAPLVNHARLPGRPGLTPALSSQMSAAAAASAAASCKRLTTVTASQHLGSRPLDPDPSATNSQATAPVIPSRGSSPFDQASTIAAAAAASSREGGGGRPGVGSSRGGDGSGRDLGNGPTGDGGGGGGREGLASLLLMRLSSVKHSASEPVLFLPNGSSNVASLDLGIGAAQQQQQQQHNWRSAGTGQLTGASSFTADSHHPQASPSSPHHTASSSSSRSSSTPGSPRSSSGGTAPPPPLRHASLPVPAPLPHTPSLLHTRHHTSSTWSHHGPPDLLPARSSSLGRGSHAAVGAGGGTGVGGASAEACPAGGLLSAVSDCVMEVVVGNVSDRYFRVWLVECGHEEEGEDAGTAAGPQTSLRPLEGGERWDECHEHAAPHLPEGTCSNPATQPACCTSVRQAPHTPAPSLRQTHPPPTPTSAAAAAHHLTPPSHSDPTPPHSHAPHQDPGPDGPSHPLDSPAAAAPAVTAPPPPPAGGRSRSFRRRSAGVSGGGGVGDVGEEEGRMTCAELVAHRWGVRWQMIVADGASGGGGGGSGSGGSGGWAAGHDLLLGGGAGGVDKGQWPAPEGVVRLSTVDIARALTPSATAVLQPSPLHIHFAAVAGGATGRGSSRLTDLGVHMDACRLSRGPTLGPVWGLRMQTGSSPSEPHPARARHADTVLRGALRPHASTDNSGLLHAAYPFSPGRTPTLLTHPSRSVLFHTHSTTGDSTELDMAVMQRASDAQAVRISLCITPFAQQPTAAAAGPRHAASDAAPGASPNKPAGPGSPPATATLARMASSPVSNTSSAGSGAAAAHAGAGPGPGLQRRAETASGGWDCADAGIDAGVLVCGVYDGLEVRLRPDGHARQRYGLTFVCPGLYQVSVGEVWVAGEGPASENLEDSSTAVACANVAMGAGKAGPQRANISVDKLYILVE
ncbi:MAG: hypothetical protein WDW38_008365 [Sanguina aurantia]